MNDKSILTKLNRSANGVNRFISTNVEFKQAFKNYPEYKEVVFTSKNEVLGLAKKLVDNIVPLTLKKSESFEELIISLGQLFSHPEIILGAKTILEETLIDQKDKLENVFNNKKKLVFTLLGYPHKMPNPLYTNSTSVDFSDVLSLQKLYKLMELLNEIYPYGVELILLTENTIFYKMSDLSDEEQKKYFDDLVYWEKLIDINNLITIKDIVDFHTPELEEKWRLETNELENKYLAGDNDAIDKVESVMPTNFMTANYRKYPVEFLLNFFDPEVMDKQLEDLREEVYNKALKGSFAYLAYHQARYKLHFMDKVFPDSFRFTVAPKKGSFGINLLNILSKVLPYYGYIVVEENKFSISYYIDLPKNLIAVYLDYEYNYPFYFRI